MGQTGHGQIGFKKNRDRYNLVYKIASQVSKINTGFIEYFPKIIV